MQGMTVKLYREPQLKDSVMFCGWPGIGNIGLVAVNTLRGILRAEELGEIEPFEFFEPQKVIIKDGLLQELQFPVSKFYFQKVNNRDLMFFIGEQQPNDGVSQYAVGPKAYKMANLVLDTAQKFGCRRLYTSGAAVTHIHHTVKPRVWAVPNGPQMIGEIKNYTNTVLMSEVEERGGQGLITGLNGLLLGVAKERGIEAVCLMGEIPYYLQGTPWPYPKASRSVLEVFAGILETQFDLRRLDGLAQRIDRNIEEFLEALSNAEGLPEQVRMEIEKLKHGKQTMLGPITDEEKKKILEHIDELFRGEDRDERKHV